MNEMKPEIIIMLTHNDKTVKNSMEVFQSCKDLPAKNWGFKDVGIPMDEMIGLNKAMKEAGKTTFLEVVTYTEEECLEGAQLAIDCGFDYLTGTIFFPSIIEKLKGTGIKYFPFAGEVGGSPIMLQGSIEDVVEDSKRIIAAGADGIDLTAYRFANGDGTELATAVADAIGRDNLMIAGSIGNTERMELMKELAPLGYTMGGALFDANFVEGGSFRENLEYVLDYMKKGE
jgi:hypothetical protein